MILKSLLSVDAIFVLVFEQFFLTRLFLWHFPVFPVGGHQGIFTAKAPSWVFWKIGFNPRKPIKQNRTGLWKTAFSTPSWAVHIINYQPAQSPQTFRPYWMWQQDAMLWMTMQYNQSSVQASDIFPYRHSCHPSRPGLHWRSSRTPMSSSCSLDSTTAVHRIITTFTLADNTVTLWQSTQSCIFAHPTSHLYTDNHLNIMLSTWSNTPE